MLIHCLAGCVVTTWIFLAYPRIKYSIRDYSDSKFRKKNCIHTRNICQNCRSTSLHTLTHTARTEKKISFFLRLTLFLRTRPASSTNNTRKRRIIIIKKNGHTHSEISGARTTVFGGGSSSDQWNPARKFCASTLTAKSLSRRSRWLFRLILISFPHCFNTCARALTNRVPFWPRHKLNWLEPKSYGLPTSSAKKVSTLTHGRARASAIDTRKHCHNCVTVL